MSEALDRLRRHLTVIDGDVAPVVDRYRHHLQCRRGCSECCHQTFRVSALEGRLLREGLAKLGAPARAEVLARARAYEPDAGHPCPILGDEGECRLYEHRPRICRKYGIPLWHPDRPEEVTTCRLNFRGATDVDADLILEPQAAWARDWVRMRERYGELAIRKATLAEHLLGGELDRPHAGDDADPT